MIDQSLTPSPLKPIRIGAWDTLKELMSLNILSKRILNTQKKDYLMFTFTCKMSNVQRGAKLIQLKLVLNSWDTNWMMLFRIHSGDQEGLDLVPLVESRSLRNKASQ